MSIAVISDLHLGARPSTDRFAHDDGEFVRFLAFLERNFERIVLLGDVWETLTGGLPHRPAEELRLARKRHRALADYFRRPKFSYVHGNHDLVAGRVDGALDELRLRRSGLRLSFVHGHQSDRLVMKARAISEAGVWLGGWLRRARLGAAYDLFDRLDRVRSQHRSDAPTGVETWAVDHARRTEADVIVTGHTHMARRSEHGRHLFMNSGSCSDGKLSFLSLEPAAGRFEVHHSY